jgi:hypothetical protein
MVTIGSANHSHPTLAKLHQVGYDFLHDREALALDAVDTLG